jgi:hypothetical protein
VGADLERTELPAACHLRRRPDGVRVVTKRNVSPRVLLGVLSVGGLGLLAVALILSAGDGDGFAVLALVVMPILLGPMILSLFANMLASHEFELAADGLVYRWRPFLDDWRSARVERLGVIFSPGTAESADQYFLGVAHTGAGLAVIPGWSADLDDLRALGQWIHDETRVPFEPDFVTGPR